MQMANSTRGAPGILRGQPALPGRRVHHAWWAHRTGACGPDTASTTLPCSPALQPTTDLPLPSRRTGPPRAEAGPPHRSHSTRPRFSRVTIPFAAAVTTVALLGCGGPCYAQQQPEAARRLALATHLSELALSFGGGSDERDPVEPFTLYGTTSKKYVIEKLSGEKVVARSRGFTVSTCVNAVAVGQETPQFQALPSGDKVQGGTCKQAESTELRRACSSSCTAACSSAFDEYAAAEKVQTGFVVDARDRTRMLRSCSRQCAYECGKGGRAYDFSVPFRR